MIESRNTDTRSLRGAQTEEQRRMMLSILIGKDPDISIEHRRLPRKLRLDGGKKRCTECGFRMRGRHHIRGNHHTSGSGGKHTVSSGI